MNNMKRFKVLGITLLGSILIDNPALGAIMWSDITAAPQNGTVLAGKNGSFNFDVINSVVPQDKKGRTIAVNTIFSSINEEDRQLSKAISLLNAANLSQVQQQLSTINAALSLLNTSVIVIGALSKSDNDAVVNTINLNAVVDSPDDPIIGINLSFSGVAVVEAEFGTFTDGASFATISVSNATFNGANIPITFTASTTGIPQLTGTPGEPLSITLPNPINNTNLKVYNIRGTGKVNISESVRGVLAIQGLTLNAQEDTLIGSRDTYAAITLTGYTATVRTKSMLEIPEPSSNLSLLALGTLGAASTLKRKLKSSKSSEKETTKVS